MHHRRVATGAAAVLAVCTALLPARGGAQPPDDLDQRLLRQLESEDSSQRTDLVKRLLDGTRTAQERLRQRRLDDETRKVQAQVLRDFDALLEELEAAAPDASPQGASGGESAAGADGSQASESTQSAADSAGAGVQERAAGEEAIDPNAAARQATERSTPGELSEVERNARRARATAAWGHLPPKMREELRGAFNEAYLPQYDELVRRYYEVLAERRRRE